MPQVLFVRIRHFDKEFKRKWLGTKRCYPIDVLPDMYSESCPLRFISEAETFKYFVPQFQNITTFKNFGYRNYRINFNKVKNNIKVW
jgi:hypothetical protein